MSTRPGIQQTELVHRPHAHGMLPTSEAGRLGDDIVPSLVLKKRGFVLSSDS
jgi:hypothetical protein